MTQLRRCFEQIETLEERVGKEAVRLREEAESLPPGAKRENLLRKAHQCETARMSVNGCTLPASNCGRELMKDMPEPLATSREEIEKCQQLRDTANMPTKRAVFERVVAYYLVLACELETAIVQMNSDQDALTREGRKGPDRHSRA